MVKAGVSRLRSGEKYAGRGTLYIVIRDTGDLNSVVDKVFLYTEEKTGSLRILAQEGAMLHLESKTLRDDLTQQFEFDLDSLELIGQVQPIDEAAYPVPDGELGYPVPLSVAGDTQGDATPSYHSWLIIVGLLSGIAVLTIVYTHSPQQ